MFFWGDSMNGKLDKYMGQTVEIIYIDRKCNITHRYVKVRAVANGAMKGFCFQQKAFRRFKLENILAIAPAARKRVG